MITKGEIMFAIYYTFLVALCLFIYPLMEYAGFPENERLIAALICNIVFARFLFGTYKIQEIEREKARLRASQEELRRKLEKIGMKTYV